MRCLPWASPKKLIDQSGIEAVIYYRYLKKYLLIIVQLLVFSSVPVFAATDILPVDAVTEADRAILMSDNNVFVSIGMGVALSIANCDADGVCLPAVNRLEMRQLIDALTGRIEKILLRYQDTEEELEDVLIAYVDTREKYMNYLNVLADILAPEEFQADIFGGEQDEYGIFEDSEDELGDDEGLEADEYEAEDI